MEAGEKNAGALAPWLVLALAGAQALPFFFTSLPPLYDYPGHLARLHIALNVDTSEHLQRFFAYEWRLIPNLGCDLIVVALAQILPLEIAMRVVAGAIPVLTVLGVCAAQRALFGRVQTTALLAIPFAFSYWLDWGFLNYLLATALAFLAFAAWVHAAGWKPTVRAVVFAALAFLVWVAHLAGWGVLVVLVGAHELMRAREGRTWISAFFQAALRAWPIALPLLAMVVGALLEPSGAGEIGWGKPGRKFLALAQILWTTDFRFDAACAALIAGAAIFLLATKRARLDRGMQLAAIVFGVALLALPFRTTDVVYLDQRLTLPLALTLLTGLAWTRPLRWIAIAAGALVAARIAVLCLAWRAADAAFARELKALDYIPRGAAVLALVEKDRTQHRPDKPYLQHLPNMAIVRRNAFVNDQWDDPAGHLLRVLHARDTPYYNADSGEIVVREKNGTPTDALAKALTEAPLHRFDYVWLLNAELAPRPQAMTHLKPVYVTERAILYEAAN